MRRAQWKYVYCTLQTGVVLTAAKPLQPPTAPAGAPHAHAPTQHTATTNHGKAQQQEAQQVAAAVSPYKFQSRPHVTQSMWGDDPSAEAPTGHQCCTIVSIPNNILFVSNTQATAARQQTSNWKNCCCQPYRLSQTWVKLHQLWYCLVALTVCELLPYSSPQLLLQWLRCANPKKPIFTCASPSFSG
jgi:hypothetical protein